MDTTLADPLLGVVLDRRYRVDAVVAHGGMSTVYSGWDLRLDRPVAIKVMSATFCAEPAFVRQFGAEARAAARLSHPNVVSVFDQGNDSGLLFLVMELVPGRTLRHLLAECGALPADLAVSLIEPVLAALNAAHRAGLAHRDVKPENVLLSDDGVVKVADFGLVHALTSATAAQGGAATMGTAAYIAPEQVSDGVGDARADVYSAGILLYEMLVGTPPYRGDNPVSVAYQHVHADVPAPSVANPEVPGELDALVVRATRRDPQERPTDAGGFLTELREVSAALALTKVAVPARSDSAEEDVAVRSGPAAVGPSVETAAPDPPPIPVMSGPAVNRTRTLHQPFAPPPPRYRLPPRDLRTPPVGADFPDEQRAHRRRGLIALVVVLLVGAAAAGAGWAYGALHYTRVPAMKGMTVVAATRAAHAEHLRVRHDTVDVYDDQAKPGRVAGSRPGQGERVARNDAITLLISKGPAPSQIPDLTGKDRRDARELLSDLGLTTTVTRVFADVESGQVAGTDPPAGSAVKSVTSVTVLVGRGSVPDTTGDARADAERTLRGVGLDVRVTRKFSDEAEAGQVASQDPSGGIVRPGATVTIVVSRGSESVRVPNVIGKDVDDARKKLEDLGFDVQVHSLFGAPVGRVVAQTPLGGFTRRRGSTVRLGVV